jgi:hypothetical protein
MVRSLLSLSGLIDLNGPERYVHWGWFQISVGNAIIVLAMIAVFVLALVVPFPGKGGRR